MFIFPAFSFAAAKRGEGQLSFESPLSPDTYRKALARWFGEAQGLDVDTFLWCFGTKSGPAGGATTAFRAGVPLEAVQQQGNRKSTAVFRYIHPSLERKTEFVSAILSSSEHPGISTPTHRS